MQVALHHLWLLDLLLGCIGSVDWQYGNHIGPQGAQHNADPDSKWTYYFVLHIAGFSF